MWTGLPLPNATEHRLRRDKFAAERVRLGTLRLIREGSTACSNEAQILTETPAFRRGCGVHDFHECRDLPMFRTPGPLRRSIAHISSGIGARRLCWRRSGGLNVLAFQPIAVSPPRSARSRRSSFALRYSQRPTRPQL